MPGAETERPVNSFRATLGLCVLLLAGCNEKKPRPVAAAATQPGLKSIDVREGIYPARLEIHTTVSPTGLLRSVRTEGKSYGPNDAPGSRERVEVRQGQVTAAQMDELRRLFAGWEQLAGSYNGVPDGPEITVRYGDKTVRGGSGAPAQVVDVCERLRELAKSMPVSSQASPTSAAAP